MAVVEEAGGKGIRAVPLCSPSSIMQRFTMKNCKIFRGFPTWLPILQAPDDEKLRAYRDQARRDTLRAEVDAPPGPEASFSTG